MSPGSHGKLSRWKAKGGGGVEPPRDMMSRPIVPPDVTTLLWHRMRYHKTIDNDLLTP